MLRIYIFILELIWYLLFPINLLTYYLFKFQFSGIFADYIDNIDIKYKYLV